MDLWLSFKLPQLVDMNLCESICVPSRPMNVIKFSFSLLT